MRKRVWAWVAAALVVAAPAGARAASGAVTFTVPASAGTVFSRAVRFGLRDRLLPANARIVRHEVLALLRADRDEGVVEIAVTPLRGAAHVFVLHLSDETAWIEQPDGGARPEPSVDVVLYGTGPSWAVIDRYFAVILDELGGEGPPAYD